MTGRVTKSDQKGRGVDQLAERRRRRGQSPGDATRETEESQGSAGVSGPQLVPSPPPPLFKVTSALGLDDDLTDEVVVTRTADEILDAFPSQPDEDDAGAAGVDLDQDEISAQLHHHHERAHQTATGPQIPRGSAQLIAAAPAARRLRVPGRAAARRRESAGRSRVAVAPRRTGRALLVAGVVSVAALGAVLTLVITGSSHTNTKTAMSDAVARSAPSAAVNAPTAALSHQLLTFVSATTTVGERVEHQAQRRGRRARTRTADRTVRTRKRADAQRRRAEAVAPPASSRPPVTSTTVAASTPRAASNAPSTTEAPTTPSVSEGASSTTGSTDEPSTSTGGSSSPAAAGPTGVGSAVGCSPKCTPH
jgi:hypothetical protein